MTIKELVEVFPACEDIEIVVREEGKGKWIQGYRIGKNAEIFPYDVRVENRGKYLGYNFKEKQLKAGEEADVVKMKDLPVKVIRKPLQSMPEYIQRLKVSYVLPRKIPRIYGDEMTHNTHELDIVCFPEGFEPQEERYDTKQDIDENGQLKGQMSFLEEM